MTGWCSNHPESPTRGGVVGDRNTCSRDDESPKSLSQLLLPQLSTPHLCAISGVMLVLVHGLQYHEDRSLSSGDRPTALCLSGHPRGSPARSAIEAVLLPLFQSRLFYPTFLLLTLLASLVKMQYNRLRETIRTTSPVPGVPAVPNAHPYMGHYGLLMDPQLHPHVFRDHATPSGISSIWGPGLKRCASVLLASHAREVLRHNSQRDFSGWIIRHGRKTLGEDSLILIPGGTHWKSVRKIVARAFTHDIVRDQRRVVGEIARELVDWLAWSCDRNTAACRAGEAGEDAADGEAADEPIEATDFFKLYSFCVFGRTALGYDFGSIPPKGCPRRRRPSSSRECMPAEAVAFELLNADIGMRATRPEALVNPSMQLYWIPTKANRTYWKNSNTVNGMMGRIIGDRMDGMLRSSSSSSSSSSQKEKETEKEDSATRSSLLSYLISSCIEKHYSNQSSSSACPFAASLQSRSSSTFSVSSSSVGGATSFHPPSEMTHAARHKIIQDVSKILHTLLLAGYETTALSLSYAMYCLAMSPRCQERCCEEARRVLGRRRRGDGSRDSSNSASDRDDGDDSFDPDDDDLPYCRAVLTESIRLNMPVVFTTRVMFKDLSLETGYNDDANGRGSRVTILKGTRVIINPEMIHRDERNFNRALEFVPERWVGWDERTSGWVDRDYKVEAKSIPTEQHASMSGTASSFATTTTPPSLSSEYSVEHSHADRIPAANPANFFAFSDGARNCVGRRLAIIESTLLIAEILRDLCVGLADRDFEMVKVLNFVSVQPSKLPLKFWKR